MGRSIEARFIHTCTIERASGTSQDAYGNTVQFISVVASGVPCRLVEQREWAEGTEPASRTMIASYSLLLPADADIAERDTVRVWVSPAEGRVFRVRSVRESRARGMHHKSAALERLE